MARGEYKVKQYEAFGEKHTIPEWARLYKLHEEDIRYYIRQRKTVEEALSILQQPSRGKTLTVGDETHTYAEWEKIVGVKRQTIEFRAKRGFPPEMCIYKGNIYGQEAREQFGFYAKRKPPSQEQNNVAVWREEIERDLTKIRGMERQTRFKVRWCDRTSHSHTWYETMVDKSDLDAFMNSHYLSKVVVDW